MKRVFSAILILAALVTAGFAPTQAQAQDSYWVQLSANATLREAEDDARAYAARLPDVSGFRLGNSGWYSVALGPYTAEVATDKLIALRAQGVIPNDSYISDGAPYGQRFWPVGSTQPAAVAEPIEDATAAAAPSEAPAVPEPQPAEPSEEFLTREEVMRLLERLEDIEEEAEKVEAQLRDSRRRTVTRDW